MRSAPNSGDNRARLAADSGTTDNNFAEVAFASDVRLSSAAYIGFTIVRDMEVQGGAPPVREDLVRDVFPLDLGAVGEEAGWLVFCGEPPESAFESASATHRAGIDRNNPSPESALRTALLADWPEDDPDRDTEIAAIVDAAFTAHRGDDTEVPETVREMLSAHTAALWLDTARLVAERTESYVRRCAEALEAEKMRAAWEWRAANHDAGADPWYLAETDPCEEGGNEFVTGNFMHHAEMRLRAVWPPQALWHRASFSEADRAKLDHSRRTGNEASFNFYDVTIRTAVARITAMADDHSGEGIRDRVLAGDDPVKYVKEPIPHAALATFRELAAEHCRTAADMIRQLAPPLVEEGEPETMPELNRPRAGDP